MISSPNIVGLRTSTAASRIDLQPSLADSGRHGLSPVRRQMSHAVLDHHHRAIDDHAEVDGPQAQQAGRDAEPQHPGEGKQHRQRDRQGDDQPCAEIAEEDEQDGDDQQPALKQVLPHRVDHVVHQLGAVVDRLDRHARRQDGSNLLQLVLQRRGDLVAVLAHEHEAQAEHRFAAAVGRHGSQADFVAGLHVGHVARRGSARRPWR